MDGDSEVIVDEQGRLMRRVRREKKPTDNDERAMQMRAAELGRVQSARKLAASDESESQSRRKKTLQEEAEILRALQAETEALEKENARRECPVPKPNAVLGRFLGFGQADRKDDIASR